MISLNASPLRYLSSFSIRNPAALYSMCAQTPAVDAWARWAVPKASFT